MAFNVNTNLNSLVAQKNASKTEGALNKAMNRLSSGLRVNGASDDAAGLAIAKNMSKQVTGYEVNVRNANDAVSLLQVAEGGMDEIGNMLQRMKDLALQSANGTNSDDQRANLNAEYQELILEIDRVVATTKFNGLDLLDGTDIAATNFYVDEGNVALTDTIQVTIDAVDTTTLGVNGGDITDEANSITAIAALDTAITTITTGRSTIGASQNRFDKAINNLQNKIVNVSAAMGRIMDADFGKETAEFSKQSIVQQAGISMMAQAKSMPQQLLSLLQ